MAVYYLPNQYDPEKFKIGCRLLLDLVMREIAEEEKERKVKAAG